MKKLLLILTLIGVVILTAYGALSGSYTTNSYFYLPGYGSYGTEEYNAYNAAMEVADNAIADNLLASGDENIEDVAGGMFSDNTEVFIDLEYQDVDGTVDATVPVKDEDTMVSDSATFLCTQQSIKAYADTLHALQYLKTEIDTQGEMETIWSVTLLNDLVDDTTPEYGGTMDHNNQRDIEVKTIEFNGLYDNGNSGAAPTINWQNGNYQKVAVSENTLFTFSNAFIGTITLQITFSGAFTAGFNAGYTILEEGGTEISFTNTNGAVDILKVMYLGTANNYVVGLMADVKD